jgi:hypothetical protein
MYILAANLILYSATPLKLKNDWMRSIPPSKVKNQGTRGVVPALTPGLFLLHDRSGRDSVCPFLRRERFLPDWYTKIQ